MSRKPPVGRANRVLRNTFLLFGSEKSAQVFSFLAFVFLTRHWDVATYGQYALIKNWVAIFATFSDLGLNALTIREVARRKGLASFYLRNVMVLRSAFSMVLVAFLALLGTLLHYEPLVVLGLVVMGLRLVLDCVQGGFVYLLQAHERMGTHGAIVLSSSVLRFLAIVSIVTLGGGVVAACWAWSLASLFALGILAFIGQRQGWKVDLTRWRWPEARKVLWQALPLAAFWSLQMLYFRIDAVLLKTLAGNEAVGFYDTAYTWLESILKLSALFGLATFPAFSSAKGDRADFSRLLGRSMKFLLLLGIPATVGVWALASPLITFFSGERYLLSGPLLSILGLSIVPFFVSNLYIIVLTIHRPILLNPLYFGLLGLNVVLNLVLIPRWGAVGAAWATVACEWIALGAGLWAIRSHLGRGLVGSIRSILCACIAAAVMGLLVHWDPRLYWILLGPLVYVALLFLLPALDPEDRATLRSFLGRGKPAR
jgi:O-antigen/teichoic acid export membrane protein